MQNVTLAIGKAGINFFIQQMLADRMIALFRQMATPDRSVHIDMIIAFGYSKAENVNVNLTQGQLIDFDPTMGNIAQQPNGVFSLSLQTSGPFKVQYRWEEAYWWISCSAVPEVGVVCEPGQQLDEVYKYLPSFSQLSINVPVMFSYDTPNKRWKLVCGQATAQPLITHPNIPGDSILNQQDQGCFSAQVDAATAQALSSIDYKGLVNGIISGMVAGIPASGNLGNGVVYDFSMGDYGIHFPNDHGIQIGISGGVSYNGTAFPGTPPAALPLPLPPADDDTHHLNLYLSGYEFDALNWAFYKAGELDATVNAADLPDPDVLKVKTYAGTDQSLNPYKLFAMQAVIRQNAAPVTSFQTVYEIDDTALNALKTQLPQAVYTLLLNMQGNNYVAKTDLENDLTALSIASDYFTTIEDASKSAGMVVTHDINYTLTIQNNQPDEPNIVFNVRRTDILANLALSLGADQTQVIQFSFKQANWQSAFVSSTVPGFNGPDFPSTWNVVGEQQYVILLQKLGSTGVPLPMLQNLQFDFANAQLSIQENYLSVLAQVQLKSQ